MRTARGWRQLQLAAGLWGYLRSPLSPDQALEEVRTRVDRRQAAFLELAQREIFGNPQSPHRALLEWAGWDHPRVERAVSQMGLDTALAQLREDGVHSSLAELKRGSPIERPGLRVEVTPAGLRSKSHGAGLRARTSGTSSGQSTEMSYEWELFRQEAGFECLLFQAHELSGVPLALWQPAPPSISGIHNLLVHLRFRSAPERWFSHIPASGPGRAAIAYLRAVARPLGVDVPAPEVVPVGAADRVAGWLARRSHETGRAVLKTFASSAVRVAEAAHRRNIDLSRCVIFAGGEPLTERRRAYIAETGATVFARYVATETGWIAGACPCAPSPDAMHVCSDRVAAIQASGPASTGSAGPLFFSSLAAGTGMVLLNTDIGDAGRLADRQCSCPLGRAGLSLELSGIYGHDKISVDGMTLPLSALRAELDGLIALAGGAPDAYQLGEEEDEHGVSRLIVALSPEVQGVDDQELLNALIERLPRQGPGAELAARFWKDSGAIQLRRERPALTAGMKVATSVSGTTQPAAATFDAERWASIYEGGVDDPRALVFRRGHELALVTCRELASPGERWIDVGCGPGHLAASLADAGVQAVGVDADQRMIDRARKRFQTHDATRLRFQRAEAGELPWEDGSVDGVVASSLMGCLSQPEAFVFDAARVLRPGGRLVLTVTNATSALHVLGARLAPGSAPSDWTVPTRTFSRKEATRLLRDASLEIERTRYYNFFLVVKDRAVPSAHVAVAIERLGARHGSLVARNMLVVARRRDT